MDEKLTALADFMEKGGVAIWVLAVLAALTAGVILWKILRLAALRAWQPRRAGRAVDDWLAGRQDAARDGLGRARGIYGIPVAATFDVLARNHLSGDAMREEIARVAAIQLARARGGLRGLELIATIAPLIGLLGTVLGMVSAFQALEAAGSRADPSALAGGIWEALLTTALGMAVAIPASAALTWFESVADRAQGRIEDMVTRLLVQADLPAEDQRLAAE
ncbi:MotA/TolQ/ExbB proton channel family protein [Maritimibacter dapengensis]|uniref:MotA/TolQ/ExbB proton channel family protein n=1 Tax=Maritimibacter dapengensis TaxID=2836868 RepID=A0ABS6SYG3_9RHOB|nr:MotA/TolQ/ExbB proton channel family protein [Maritimibacter dapengensis]MBV7378006.1 MotA/TolQ/ExbB proton channel family protein [Maritimibacter dapengensis]